MPVARQLTIQIPEGLSQEDEKAAKEAAVIALYQKGAISTRRAAEMLRLTYRQYLDLLAERGIPQATPPLHPDTIERVIAKERREA